MKIWKKILIIVFCVLLILTMLSKIFEITLFRTNVNSAITKIEQKNTNNNQTNNNQNFKK